MPRPRRPPRPRQFGDPPNHRRRPDRRRRPAPGIRQHIDLVRHVPERRQQLGIADRKVRPRGLPADRQQPAPRRGPHRQHGIHLASDDARAGGSVIRARLVHVRRRGIDLPRHHQPFAAEIAPAREFPRRIEVGMIQLAPVVGHAHHHVRAPEPVQPLPRRLAAGRGAGVELGMLPPGMQMPLRHVRRIGRHRHRVRLHPLVEIVLRPLHQRFLLGQAHHQLHRVHPGMIGQLEQVIPRPVASLPHQPVPRRERVHLLRPQRLPKRHQHPVRHQVLPAGLRQPVRVMRRRQLPAPAHRRLQFGRRRGHPRGPRRHLLGVQEPQLAQPPGQSADHETVGLLFQRHLATGTIGINQRTVGHDRFLLRDRSPESSTAAAANSAFARSINAFG